MTLGFKVLPENGVRFWQWTYLATKRAETGEDSTRVQTSGRQTTQPAIRIMNLGLRYKGKAAQTEIVA
eukprot:scaffold346838_cov45-Prasinocladus_malaysianus.AAC.1